MLTHIEFDSEIDILASIASHKRRILTRRHNIQQARKILIKDGAPEGQVWNFTVDVVCMRKDGSIVENYIDKFPLII